MRYALSDQVHRQSSPRKQIAQSRRCGGNSRSNGRVTRPPQTNPIAAAAAVVVPEFGQMSFADMWPSPDLVPLIVVERSTANWARSILIWTATTTKVMKTNDSAEAEDAGDRPLCQAERPAGDWLDDSHAAGNYPLNSDKKRWSGYRN